MKVRGKYVFKNISGLCYNHFRDWIVLFHEEFDAEFIALRRDVQTASLAKVRLLEVFGPQLNHPHVDTLKGSKHPNMKELPFDAADGAWRAAFAFDPLRRAIILVAGGKCGGGKRRFYHSLIATVDRRFEDHLGRMEKGE